MPMSSNQLAASVDRARATAPPAAAAPPEPLAPALADPARHGRASLGGLLAREAAGPGLGELPTVGNASGRVTAVATDCGCCAVSGRRCGGGVAGLGVSAARQSSASAGALTWELEPPVPEAAE
jgi:hypothetical protein